MTTARHGEITVAYDGRFYSWFRTGGAAKHSYKADDAIHQQKFRYTLSQELASQQKMQELVDQVGGPLARDPKVVEQEREILRQAGVRID